MQLRKGEENGTPVGRSVLGVETERPKSVPFSTMDSLGPGRYLGPVPDLYKKILAVLAAAAAFLGIAVALFVDAGVTRRWNESMTKRDAPTEAETPTEAEEPPATRRPGP